MPSLCLNMIVKNEARIIERCLESVAPWISCYAISDTGSQDETPERIQHFFEDRNIPGLIHRAGEFRDFRSAREDALVFARSALLPNFDHILLCDADMVLRVDEPSGWAMLGNPAMQSFSIPQRMGGLDYDNVRVVRRDSKATYCGPKTTRTHEIIVGPGIGASPSNRLPGIWFDDRGDGSSHKEKFERDIKLLLQDLDDDPKNERAVFYLAESYRNAGQPQKALGFYKAREELGGYPDEAWFAGFCVVRCLIAMGKLDEALAKAMLVFEKNPARAEPLVEMARALREAGRNELASMLAERAAAIPKPHGLFVDVGAHAWGAKQELAIAGFYSKSEPIRNAGRDACFALSVDRGVPPQVRAAARNNSRFWAEPLQKHLRHAPIVTELPSCAEDWHAMNPSVFRHEETGELWAVLRHVNYRIADSGAYIIPESENGRVRTRNYLVRLDADTLEIQGRSFEILSLASVADTVIENGSMVHGFEDLRPFLLNDGELWAMATSLEHTHDVRAQQVLLHFHEDWRKGKAIIVEAFPQLRTQHQKNWLPFVESRAKSARVVFASYPTMVLATQNGRQILAEITRSIPERLALDGFRGSSHVVPLRVNDAPHYLYVVHEAHDIPNEMRVYTHRFVLLDSALRAVGVSVPFTFGSGERIEFCAGMTGHTGGALVLSYGVRDARAYVMRIAKHDAIRMVRP